MPISIGGSGGVAGNGGNVQVNDNSGTIDTFGDYAYGILAQSVGGGGGAGGFSMGGNAVCLPAGAGFGIGGAGSSGGTGGNVTVTPAIAPFLPVA